MKIKVWCDSGANIHSRRSDTLDLEDDFGITNEEWSDYTEEQKYELVQDWANERLDIGFREV